MVRSYLPQQFKSNITTNYPPQGFESGGIAPPVMGDPIKVSFPQIGDIDYLNYKFYQVNKGELPTPEIDYILEISDIIGAGKFLNMDGNDIRAFTGTGRDLANTINTLESFDPQLGGANVSQLSPDKLHLFVWVMNTNIIHEWVLSAPGVLPANGTPSDYTFDATIYESNGRDLTFIDNGNKFIITGTNSKKIQMFSLPVKGSFVTPPIFVSDFDVSYLTSRPEGVDYSPDGTKLILLSGNNDSIHQWSNLPPLTFPAPSTPPDRSFTYDPNITESVGNIRYSKDGDFLYMNSLLPTAQISRYNLTDGKYNIPITNKIPDDIFAVTSLDNNPRANTFFDGESEIFISGRQNDTVYKLFVPGIPLDYQIITIVPATGAFTIKVKVPLLADLDFIQIAFGDVDAVDNSISLPASDAIPSLHTTPLLTINEDNILVDDQGRQIVAVGQ